MFYKDGLFSIFATTNFDANSTRTLVFATTGGCEYKDRPMIGFGVTLTNLTVRTATDFLYDKILWRDSCTIQNRATIIGGRETIPLNVLIQQQQTVETSIVISPSDDVLYVPVAGSTDANLCGAGSLLLGSFKIDGVEYKDTPYLIMVTNG